MRARPKGASASGAASSRSCPTSRKWRPRRPGPRRRPARLRVSRASCGQWRGRVGGRSASRANMGAQQLHGRDSRLLDALCESGVLRADETSPGAYSAPQGTNSVCKYCLANVETRSLTSISGSLTPCLLMDDVLLGSAPASKPFALLEEMPPSGRFSPSKARPSTRMRWSSRARWQKSAQREGRWMEHANPSAQSDTVENLPLDSSLRLAQPTISVRERLGRLPR